MEVKRSGSQTSRKGPPEGEILMVVEWRGAVITKQIQANLRTRDYPAYKLRELPEGIRLDLIIITDEEARPHSNAGKILANIAALPIKSASDFFSGREHDSILYAKKPVA